MKLTRPLRLLFLVTGFVLLLRLISIPVLAADAEYDLVIRDGRVMDGSGDPWFRADIGIRQGKIAARFELHRRLGPGRFDRSDARS